MDDKEIEVSPVKEKVKYLARLSQDLLDEAQVLRGTDYQNVISTHFQDEENNLHFDLIVVNSNEYKIGLFEDVPENLGFPIFYFSGSMNKDFHPKSPIRILTDYGYLPPYFIGGDNSLYHVYDVYYYDPNGNSARDIELTNFETDSPEKAEKMLEQEVGVHVTYDQIPRVDVLPEMSGKDTHTSYRPFNLGDCEKIEAFLINAKEGKLVSKGVGGQEAL